MNDIKFGGAYSPYDSQYRVISDINMDSLLKSSEFLDKVIETVAKDISNKLAEFYQQDIIANINMTALANMVIAQSAGKIADALGGKK